MIPFSLQIAEVMEKKKPSEKAIEIAACCWTTPETESIAMDVRLARAFAEAIEPYLLRLAAAEERELQAARREGRSRWRD